MGVRIGTIGPERGRCLERLRRSGFLAELSDDQVAAARITVLGK
jgi:hypothetical protein